MLFTCVSMVLSLTIFAYILGEISNLVMDQDAELVKTRTQVGVKTSAHADCTPCVHTPAGCTDSVSAPACVNKGEGTRKGGRFSLV